MTHSDTMVPEAGNAIIQVLPIPGMRGTAVDIWCMRNTVSGHAHAQLTAAETLELIMRLEMSIQVENVPAGWRGLQA